MRRRRRAGGGGTQQKRKKKRSRVSVDVVEMPESHLTKCVVFEAYNWEIERKHSWRFESVRVVADGFMLPFNIKRKMFDVLFSWYIIIIIAIRNATASSEKKDGDDDFFFEWSTPKDDENVFNFFDSPVQSSPTEESQHQIDPLRIFRLGIERQASAAGGDWVRIAAGAVTV